MATVGAPAERPVSRPRAVPSLSRLALGITALKALPLVAAAGLVVWLAIGSVPSYLETTCAEGELCGEGQGLLLFIALVVFVPIAFAVPLLGLQAFFARRRTIKGLVIISFVLNVIDSVVIRFLINDWRNSPGLDRELAIAFVIAVPLIALQVIVTIWSLRIAIVSARATSPAPS